MIIDTERLGECVELSHDLVRGMPNHSSHPEFNFIPYYRLGDFELADEYWGCNELILMSGHSGTHLDALGHVATSGQVFGDISARDAQSGIEGLTHHGIETVRPIIRRGWLFDIASIRQEDIVDPATAIGADDLEAAAAANGLEVGAGDCVFVRTGWSSHWTSPETYLGASGSPGIDVSGAEWFADLGVHLVGGETAVVEHIAPGQDGLPVHQTLLSGHGVHLMENMDLSGLIGWTSFLFLCLPLKVRGASGSPVRPVALAPTETP